MGGPPQLDYPPKKVGEILLIACFEQKFTGFSKSSPVFFLGGWSICGDPPVALIGLIGFNFFLIPQKLTDVLESKVQIKKC
jgi:hypothetical protein